jgi:hypothetical protein
MKYDRVVEETVRKAQNILWANLPPLSDELIVKRISALISVPAVQEALEHCSDTVPVFALRGVHRVLSDRAEPPRATLDRLCDILNEPDLNQALGIKQNTRMNLWLKKPPAR